MPLKGIKVTFYGVSHKKRQVFQVTAFTNTCFSEVCVLCEEIAFGVHDGFQMHSGLSDAPTLVNGAVWISSSH